MSSRVRQRTAVIVRQGHPRHNRSAVQRVAPRQVLSCLEAADDRLACKNTAAFSVRSLLGSDAAQFSEPDIVRGDFSLNCGFATLCRARSRSAGEAEETAAEEVAREAAAREGSMTEALSEALSDVISDADADCNEVDTAAASLDGPAADNVGNADADAAAGEHELIRHS